VKPYLSQGKKGLLLAIRVVPNARKNEIAGFQEEGRVKIRLQAPPVEGRANQALVKFLAKVLQVPASSITIAAGSGSRDKLVSIQNLDSETANQRIINLIS
jgi:uncharacterized protein